MNKMKCGSCPHIERLVYTSCSPRAKCTITGEYRSLDQECDMEWTTMPVAEEARNARSCERMDEVFSLLKDLWQMVPDWRFGQLIMNLFEHYGNDVFYVEDDKMCTMIRHFKAVLIESFGTPDTNGQDPIAPCSGNH